MDVAITAMDNVIAWNRRGGDFIIIGQIEQTTPLTLWGGPSVREISEVAGARLAVDAADSGFAIALRALLKRHRIPDQHCSWLPLGGVKQRSEALLAGRCDATLLGPPFDDLVLRAGCHALTDLQESWQQFPGQGIVARKTTIQDHAAALRKYLEIIGASLSWANEHKERAMNVLVEAQLPPTAAQAMLRTAARDLRPSPAGIDLLIQMRSELNLLDGPAPNYASLVDQSLLPRKLA
ncbi:ABC transporter substrate-binding protein [Bradyrhizobium genosp. P]|uniref:ABC transporter substrate-binding protein n=1 Tax=Bradyrhizobium genosp. P TaxID=83641 RepID=UPI003CE73815